MSLGPRSYNVLIGAGLLGALGERVAGVLGASGGGGRAFAVADAGLPDVTVALAVGSLQAAGYAVGSIRLKPTEQDKSLGTLQAVLAQAARHRLERSEAFIALGGGIIGDLTGFAASVYRRGVPVVQCPTTLLAMVDASVGGKTAVNLALPGDASLTKNMVGAFHQPALVVADVATLASLPPREFRCGLAECVKHGLIAADWGDPGLLAWLEQRLDAIVGRAPELLAELVRRNVAVKAAVVAADEREEAEPTAGGRALLNLGHTFAHAIETLPGLSPDGAAQSAPLKHGEAVAFGLLAACCCAAQLGACPPGTGARVQTLLTRIGLPTKVRGLPPTDAVITSMRHDKKITGGRLRLVLPVGATPGQAAVFDDPPSAAVTAAVESIRA